MTRRHDLGSPSPWDRARNRAHDDSRRSGRHHTHQWVGGRCQWCATPPGADAAFYPCKAARCAMDGCLHPAGVPTDSLCSQHRHERETERRKLEELDRGFGARSHPRYWDR